MDGLKFRGTRLIKILQDSLGKLSYPKTIIIHLKSSLTDESVWMDHEQMAMVFLDLAKNAVEAMPHGGTLNITAGGDDHQVIVTLSDTGKGISKENLPLLFTPFFTTKPVGEGTGLGLPQAFSIVKGHSGDISFESNADPQQGPTGTTVRITLPRRQKFQDKEARVILHEEGD